MGDRLKGRVAVVTGSGAGVGKAIALAMAKEGAKVITNNRWPGSTGLNVHGEKIAKELSPEEKEWTRRLSGDAEATAKEIEDMGGEAVAFYGDVSDFKTAGKLIQTAVDKFGKIDILVNNAGTFRRSFIWELSEEDWDHVTLAKLKGAFNCTRHASPLMKEQRWGRIINCTSPALLGILQHSNYGAANAGAVGLTRAVARDLYQYGVTCNAYAPHAVTRGSPSLLAWARVMAEVGTPILGWEKRTIADLETQPGPEALAPFIVYLATDEAAHISGTVFSVGGNKIVVYSEPVEKKVIEKEAGLWTVDELIEQVPKELMEGYKSPAA